MSESQAVGLEVPGGPPDRPSGGPPCGPGDRPCECNGRFVQYRPVGRTPDFPPCSSNREHRLRDRIRDAAEQKSEIPYSRRIALAALVAAGALTGCGAREDGPMAPPPPEVVVATVTNGDLPLELAYTGRAVGSREVEVRALVSGIVLQRRYEEGSAVRRGDVLFLIDPDRYRAAVEQARAELGVEQARLAEARRQRDRLESLLDRKLVSQRQLDEAVSAFEVAEANTAAAQARLRTAELDFSYTEVRAPISGLTSREVRSEGSLAIAGDDSSLLTRIVQTDPIYVEFSLPEREAAQVRARLAAGRAPTVRVGLEDGAEHPTAGDTDLHRQRRRGGIGHRAGAGRAAEPGRAGWCPGSSCGRGSRASWSPARSPCRAVP